MAQRLAGNKNFRRSVLWVHPNGKGVSESNLARLLANVRALRARDGGDLSEGWELRLQDEICSKEQYNGMCYELDDQPVVDEPVKYIGRADVQRFFNVVKKFIASGGKLESNEEATRRAEICINCPSNVPIRGCMGCSGLIPKLLKLTKGASTKLDKQLKGCGVCGCQLKAKVHLPASLSQDDNLKFPEHCWINEGDL